MNDKEDELSRIQRDDDKVGIITNFIAVVAFLFVIAASAKTVIDWILT